MYAAMFQESDGHVTSKYGGHMINRELFMTLKKKKKLKKREKVKILALNVCFMGRKWLLLWDPVLLLNIYQQ